MITSTDPEYRRTKRIKQGIDRMAPPFDELANWIANTWDVTVLNVIYDRAITLHAPRLQVILEHSRDARKFRRGYNFDRSKQQAIAAQFRHIIKRQPDHGFEVDGLFVVFSAFAPLAREEADGRLSERDIDRLKVEIGNADLWKISRSFGHVTFMFYTDAQAQRYAAGGKKEEYARKYFEILKPHDEFGYLLPSKFKVQFDSKQNFDDNYAGNWYYYYK